MILYSWFESWTVRATVEIIKFLFGKNKIMK
ncbi:hypothetical protein J2T04_003731 [Chryseobacterium lathyri]|uniref:Uncharacterized protein n=1 Tax=Chryseobacterium lathyri TaxID=395933 RepID=A0ABT9SQV3_9FLAO|nr:hypothetical protein [Chryseobacterium lathyri]